MWLHSNMWTTPQAFQNYDKKNAAFIYRLHKVSILQEHSAIRAYFAVTTSIRYTYTFFFLCCSLMCLSVSFISQFPSFFSLEPVSHRFSLANIFYGIFRYFFSGPRLSVCNSMWIRNELVRKIGERANESSGRDTATLWYVPTIDLMTTQLN